MNFDLEDLDFSQELHDYCSAIVRYVDFNTNVDTSLKRDAVIFDLFRLLHVQFMGQEPKFDKPDWQKALSEKFSMTIKPTD